LFNTGDVGGFGSNDMASLGVCSLDTPDDIFVSGGLESEMGDGMYQIDVSGVKVKGLASATFQHFCLITETNEVICWGLDNLGKLGLGSNDNPT
jgi:hypothetical protein